VSLCLYCFIDFLGSPLPRSPLILTVKVTKLSEKFDAFCNQHWTPRKKQKSWEVENYPRWTWIAWDWLERVQAELELLSTLVLSFSVGPYIKQKSAAHTAAKRIANRMPAAAVGRIPCVLWWPDESVTFLEANGELSIWISSGVGPPAGCILSIPSIRNRACLPDLNPCSQNMYRIRNCELHVPELDSMSFPACWDVVWGVAETWQSLSICSRVAYRKIKQHANLLHRPISSFSKTNTGKIAVRWNSYFQIRT